MSTPGTEAAIIEGLAFRDYQAAPGVNDSTLKEIFESPGRVPWRAQNPVEVTPAMLRGAGIDCAALEPDDFPRRYVSPPMRPEELPPHFVAVPPEYIGKNGAWLKAGKDWRAEQEAAGRVCVKPGDWNGAGLKTNTDAYRAWRAYAEDQGFDVLTPSERRLILDAGAAVLEYSLARALIDAGAAQCSVFWQDAETGLWCKGRPDIVIHEVTAELVELIRACAGPGVIAPLAGTPIVVDLKSTGQRVNPDAAASLCFNAGWYRQLAFYCDGLSAVTGREYYEGWIIAVEQDPPHRVEVYQLPVSVMEQGRDEYRAALEMYAGCDNAGYWPLSTGMVQRIEFKPWMTR